MSNKNSPIARVPSRFEENIIDNAAHYIYERCLFLIYTRPITLKVYRDHSNNIVMMCLRIYVIDGPSARCLQFETLTDLDFYDKEMEKEYGGTESETTSETA